MQAALFGLCPDCGSRTLFAGLLRFAGRCPRCGLDFDRFNVGDGPAALLIMLVGAIIVAAAVTLQLSQHPPAWVHALLWVPLSTLLVIGSLRVAKAMLLIIEHRRDAHEGIGE